MRDVRSEFEPRGLGKIISDGSAPSGKHGGRAGDKASELQEKEVRSLRDSGEMVRMRLPAEPFSRQLIRLAVFLVGSRMHFDLSTLEDVRLAVDEASSYAISHSPPESPLEVEIETGKEYLEIELRSRLAEDGDKRTAIPESFSRLIMESVVDHLDLQREEDSCRILLRKRCAG